VNGLHAQEAPQFRQHQQSDDGQGHDAGGQAE
jgi:hypothetical protein